ncbi:MAG TPA: protein kinase [Gemmatimonadaceae bacterium]|nr:protein kinase [Gemmatimonadaceae bacterium]
MAEPNISSIGKYRILELVGEGAMGVVYRAHDPVLERTVAIKVMNESIARQEDLRKRFLREAQAAGSLQHPNVVTVYDLGEADGHLFIAMEFVPGVDLERMIELGEPLSLQSRLDIAIDVLTGLAYAHRKGIVHRDIKPANIRIAEDGRAKIMDFGVAHLSSSSMTRTGSFLGTPSYMAPEQITQGQTTAATDIFAVGAVLYQLLASMKPFDAPTLQNLLYKIITEKPRPLSELTPGLPPSLERIVMKALEKDPPARYASALDMANDLTRERAKLSGPAYPASLSLSASVADAIEQSRKVTQNRSKRVAIAGGVALAAAIAIVIFRGPLSRSGAPQRAADTAAPSLVETAVAQPASQPLAQSAETPPAVAAAPPTPARSTPQRTPTEKPRVTTRETRTVAVPNKPPPRVTQAPATNQPAATVPLAVSPAPVNAQRQDPLPSAPVVEAPRPAVKQETTAATPPAPNPSDIGPAVQAYARAIESRDVGAIRRVYPGLTADQQRGFEQFFQSTRSINVTFRVTNVEAAGSSADARLVGTYEYVTTAGQSQREPVSFAATLRHEGGQWKLVSVR